MRVPVANLHAAPGHLTDAEAAALPLAVVAPQTQVVAVEPVTEGLMPVLVDLVLLSSDIQILLLFQ